MLNVRISLMEAMKLIKLINSLNLFFYSKIKRSRGYFALLHISAASRK